MVTNGASKQSASTSSLEDLLATTSHPAFQRRGRGPEQGLPNPLEASIEPSSGHQPVTGREAPAPEAQEAKSNVFQSALADSLCVGEVAFPPDTNPLDLVRIWKGLEEDLKVEMLSMHHSSTGTTVKCAVEDLAPLLAWLATLGRVMSWSFTTPGQRDRAM